MGIAAAPDAPRAQGAMTAPSAPAGLLARWGIPADA